MSYELLSKLFYKEPDTYEARYDQRFHSDTAIKLPLFINNHQAFFMTPLEMINKTEAIFKLNTAVNVITKEVPVSALNFLINRFLKDEIALTNDIEGITSTKKEIETAVSSQNNKKKVRFKGLAAKYMKLIQANEISLNTCEDIRKLYDDIVSDEIAAKNAPDGKIFRKDMVHIVSATQKEKHRGIMPETQIIEYMNYCLDLLKSDRMNTLIKTAVFHYFFGYIHPFYDGNGRTSRFISSCLLKDELGLLISLRLSYVIKNNLKVYYNAFDICNDVRNKGEITYFILMFLDLLAEAGTYLVEILNNLRDQLFFYKTLIDTSDMKKTKKELLNILCQVSLFAESYMTVDELQQFIKLGNTSIRYILKELDEEGYLIKTKNGKKIGYAANLASIDRMKQG
ncbi:MAG: Fic family protein [Erysipelotrichaceae bacterium]|nr:Fic family protein [Erysipelotrichaceae bacterium]